jgi:predicted membrane-bound mannosyltransferase
LRFWSVRMRLRIGNQRSAGILPADVAGKGRGPLSTNSRRRLWKMILSASAVFIFITVLLFTWFGQNWQVFADLFHAAGNFAHRAGGEGHEKPFGYYVRLLCDGRSGAVILGLSLLGMIYVISQLLGRPKLYPLAPRIFLTVYALGILIIYSAIPYKTPWLALNFWLPLALLTGMAIEWIWFVTTKCSVRGIILMLLIGLGFLIQHDTRLRVFQKPADEKNPYAYAHTIEDVLDLPQRIADVAQQNHLSQPRIAVIGKDAWPLPWYLRKFSQVGFWQPGQDPGAADFYITTDQVPDELQKRFESLRPDFFGVRPNILVVLWSPPVDKKP